jgi:AAA family ATP:ADP antiporter
VKNTIQDPGLVNKFFFNFGMYVQIIACSFALIGNSFFQRYLGVRFCLIMYPALLGCCITGYMFYPSFKAIFVVMLIVKALGYTLNRPASEMLYIPTSRNIKYKSKAWIEMFGTRFSKASGSVVNQCVGPIVLVTGSLSLVAIVLWIALASVLGNTFSRAVHNEKLIE